MRCWLDRLTLVETRGSVRGKTAGSQLPQLHGMQAPSPDLACSSSCRPGMWHLCAMARRMWQNRWAWVEVSWGEAWWQEGSKLVMDQKLILTVLLWLDWRWTVREQGLSQRMGLQPEGQQKPRCCGHHWCADCSEGNGLHWVLASNDQMCCMCAAKPEDLSEKPQEKAESPACQSLCRASSMPMVALAPADLERQWYSQVS